MVFAVTRAYGALARSTVQLHRRLPSSDHLPSLLQVHAKPAVAYAFLQRRTLATASSSSDDKVLVYEAPMARAVRLMKGVSLTSCFLTSVGMPVLCYVSMQSTSIIGKWAMCGTIMLFGLGTTSLYHVLFQPYVLRMWIETPTSLLQDDTVVTAETLTMLAQRRTHQFTLGDVSRPGSSMHPMISFRAKDKNYFIHPEVLQDNDLVKKLMGEDFQIVKKAQDKEHEDDDYY